MSEVENLELKKRARRRLVGAAALALFAIIVLPMIMDEEPGSLQNNDVQVTIPDRAASEALPAPVDGHPVEPSEATTVVALSPDAVEQVVIAPVTPSAQPDQPPPRQPEPVAAPNKPPVVTAEKPPKPATPPATNNSVLPGSSEEARVRAILEGKSDKPAATQVAAVQRYFVQIGAFGDRNKAVSLSDSLGKQGFQAYSEQADAVTRVRIGPFSNRQEAEQTVTKLKSLGMNGVVMSR